MKLDFYMSTVKKKIRSTFFLIKDCFFPFFGILFMSASICFLYKNQQDFFSMKKTINRVALNLKNKSCEPHRTVYNIKNEIRSHRYLESETGIINTKKKDENNKKVIETLFSTKSVKENFFESFLQTQEPLTVDGSDLLYLLELVEKKERAFAGEVFFKTLAIKKDPQQLNNYLLNFSIIERHETDT